MNGQETDSRTGTSAVIDTAGSFIIGPTEDVNPIMRAIRGFPVEVTPRNFNDVPGPDQGTKFPPSYTYYAYPCGVDVARPNIELQLGNNQDKFAVNPRDLSIQLINRADDNFRDVPGSTRLRDALAADTMVCFASFVGRRMPNGNPEPQWALGTAFLRNWYTTLTWRSDENGEVKSVSFAKAIDEMPAGDQGTVATS